jgi:hypothetical protein
MHRRRRTCDVQRLPSALWCCELPSASTAVRLSVRVKAWLRKLDERRRKSEDEALNFGRSASGKSVTDFGRLALPKRGDALLYRVGKEVAVFGRS